MTQSTAPGLSYMERMWEVGQQHLAAGRYVTARRELEAAEAIAWRTQDAQALARIYLPLLETRRQMRQSAAEGVILIATSPAARRPQLFIERIIMEPAGTLILGCTQACKTAGSVQFAARRLHACLESLVVVEQRGQQHVATLADPTFAAGLAIERTQEAGKLVDASAGAEMTLPLPPDGMYRPGEALHGMARESLLAGWEGLALRWQTRHPLHARERSAWEEIAWLRLALRVDPACEAIIMRVIAVAEELMRQER